MITPWWSLADRYLSTPQIWLNQLSKHYWQKSSERHRDTNLHPIYRQTPNKEHFAQYLPISNAFYAKLCGSWRGIKTRVERQTTTSSHVRVRHPWETCSFTSFRASISSLNHRIFTYFVQQKSFLSSCYHLNLKHAFKVKNLVPMTMRHGRYHWLRALYQVLVRKLTQKKSLLLTK